MFKRFVFGLGTGRCGTLSLAHLLSRQKETYVTHELSGKDLSWTVDADLFKKYYNTIEGFEHSVVGDVSFVLLPYVPLIMQKCPTTKFVVLRRDREETIQSYVEKTAHKGTDIWHTSSTANSWAKCYPSFEGTTKEENIGLYYDKYYADVESYMKRFPESFFLLDTYGLNDESKLMEMLTFCGYSNPSPIKMHRNKGPA